MRKISKKELNKILDDHQKWIDTRYTENVAGKRADLSEKNLFRADLRGADLRDAILRNAFLRGADLSGAILSRADLRWADLPGADLSNATLTGADFSHADLSGAKLGGADLKGAILFDAYLGKANLRGAYINQANLTAAWLTGADTKNICYDYETVGFASVCPECGTFVGFKRAQDKIVTLFIPEDAKRTSGTTRKCRCNKAKVLSITNLDGSMSELTEVPSDYDENFIYQVGEYVEEANFDENRWEDCTTGIHFFITRDEAVRY